MLRQELVDFLARFKFTEDKSGYVGVEREHFLLLSDGRFVPRAEEFLRIINDPRWTYELSACQVESRTRPQKDLSAIILELLENANIGRITAEKLGLRLFNSEVGDMNMPLNVYPNQRYLEIVRTLPQERLMAACRVTGTHLHLGVKNIDQALSVYNVLVSQLGYLCRLGDHSYGERIELYKSMAVNWQPVIYENVEHFFAMAVTQGFCINPRNCWHLIRISIHGTVELRMFGVTDYIDEIIFWISRIKDVLKEVWG